MEQKYQAELEKLNKRFVEHGERHGDPHGGLPWKLVESKLLGNLGYLEIIARMEETGGEPEVVGGLDAEGFITVMDCSLESPQGRRSLCYDDEALLGRKENKPRGSAVGLAREMGIELLDEEQYRRLQAFGPFDEKTSSWVKTPESMRLLGGALFCDRRYKRVFSYHNGAESYYAARGFRGFLSF